MYGFINNSYFLQFLVPWMKTKKFIFFFLRISARKNSWRGNAIYQAGTPAMKTTQKVMNLKSIRYFQISSKAL